VAGQPGLQARVIEAANQLAAEFRGTFSPQTVELLTRRTFDSFSSARITEFVPLLVYRDTRERLLSIARTKAVRGDHPQILFVCVHNAGRSQMAAAFARQLGAGRVSVRSAGTAPAEHIHAGVLEAMRETGVDISGESPQPLSDQNIEETDIVITMGCGDACPVVPGTMYADWEVRDPTGRPIDEIRAIRDEIRERVVVLLEELGVETAVQPAGSAD
jgi:protein-tyrosine-phosphatase